MVFGRKKKNAQDVADAAGSDAAGSDAETAAPAVADDSGADDSVAFDSALDAVTELAAGPYDHSELDEDADPTVGASGARLDLGSVWVPLPEGGQIQVEMSANQALQALHLVTPHGRITVGAYAAPKSPGQWRQVAAELAETLRQEYASVSVENGPWGRELVGTSPQGVLRFIGVDGPRWMVRCVAVGPEQASAQLMQAAREVLRDTVVKRGPEPLPVREPLPLVLPAVLAEQLAHAQQQQPAQQPQPAQQTAGPAAGAPESAPEQSAPEQSAPERRGAQGSAMQQLGQRRRH